MADVNALRVKIDSIIGVQEKVDYDITDQKYVPLVTCTRDA